MFADSSIWHTGIELLAEVLRLSKKEDLTLMALTKDAAAELAELMHLPVAVIDQLPVLPNPRPLVKVRRGADETSFLFSEAEGDQVVRRAQLEIFNWVRLRRLADLRAADPDDIDMHDLTKFARGEHDVKVSIRAERMCILCVVPNGVGLGHITRMIAISKAIQDEIDARIVFWSFSRAAEILIAAGYEVFLRQNVMHLAAHPPDWRLWETKEFASVIRKLEPSVVCYDGGTFDMFIIDALRSVGCGRCGVAWIRRGMLHQEADAQMLEAEQYCDVVVEPGDLAVEMDMGPTRMRKAQKRGFSERIVAPPVTLKPYLSSYSRSVARRKLGLGFGRCCLVSLGGAFGNWDILRQEIIDQAAEQRVKLIWAQSPLAGSSKDDLAGATIRRFYPLSRYMAAFDGMISAAGYNSYHELILGYDGPVLFTPTNNVRLDDQSARASYAGQQGWAWVVHADAIEDQAHVIAEFMATVRKGRYLASRPSPVQGAPEIAKKIVSVADKYI